MSEKRDAQALRAPDAFQRAGGAARDWLIAHGTKTLWVVAALLGVGFAVMLVGYLQRRAEGQAERDLGQALRVVERPVSAEAAAPGEQPPFPTQRAKDEEVAKSLAAFRARSGNTRASRFAALPQAHAELRLGRAEAALSLLGEFAAKARPEDPLRVLARESEGYAHEARGELVEARAAFERMSAETHGDFLSGMGLYHRARILLLEGKKQDAAAAFADVSIRAPGTAAARLAAERNAELAAQGIVAPAPAAGVPVVADAGSAP